jgi:hypothetical protein
VTDEHKRARLSSLVDSDYSLFVDLDDDIFDDLSLELYLLLLELLFVVFDLLLLLVGVDLGLLNSFTLLFLLGRLHSEGRIFVSVIFFVVLLLVLIIITSIFGGIDGLLVGLSECGFLLRLELNPLGFVL